MDVVRTNVERIGGQGRDRQPAGEGNDAAAAHSADPGDHSGADRPQPQAELRSAAGGAVELVHVTPDQATTRSSGWRRASLPAARQAAAAGVPDDCLAESALEQPEDGEAAAGCYIAVLNADGRRFGLVVDGLADPEEIVVKPLSAVLKKIGLFSGATVLGNGELALILDPGAIAARVGNRSQRRRSGDSRRLRNQLPCSESEFLLMRPDKTSKRFRRTTSCVSNGFPAPALNGWAKRLCCVSMARCCRWRIARASWPGELK